MLDAGTCYLKAERDIKGGPYARDGRIACVVKARVTAKFERVAGVDYHPETAMSSVKAEDDSDCCDECHAYPGCVVGVFYDGVCYLKGSADISGGAYNRTGRIACSPVNSSFAHLDRRLHDPPRANVSNLAWVDLNSVPSTSWMSPGPWSVPEHEEHGPYQHGGMFPGFNGGGNLFTPPVVVSVQPGYQVGAAVEGYMRTETGCSVLSSFESMSGTLDEADWSMHSAPMHERNYPCDPIVWSYFGREVDLDATGAAAFQKQLYFCMLGQALQRRTNIESWRSGNMWAVLLWQVFP